jgi:hypothetical protein
MSRSRSPGARRLLRTVMLLFAAAASVAAATPARADEKLPRRAVYSGTFDDMLFAAGEHVIVEGTATDDVIAAGRDVRINADVAEDVIAAGQKVTVDRGSARKVIAAGANVELRDAKANDLVAVGFDVDVSGDIDDDVLAAGATVSLRPGSAVGGTVIAAGGDLSLEGSIAGSVRVAGGSVFISGEILGDVDVRAGDLVIARTANIAGKVTYRGDEPPVIADGAVIGGGVTRLKPDFEPWKREPVPWYVLIWAPVILLLGLGVLTLAVQAAVPDLLRSATERLEDEPWTSLGVGFALLVAAPVAAVVLMATVVGLPLGVFGLVLYVAVLAPAFLTTAYWLGLWAAQRFGRGARDLGLAGRTLWTFAGLVVIGVVGLIPLLGQLVTLFATALGLGAVVAPLARRLHMVTAA